MNHVTKHAIFRLLALTVVLASAPAFASAAVAAPAPAANSFERALDAIVASDTPLGAQRAQVDAARARLLGAQALFLPTFSLSASEKRQEIPRFDGKIYDATASINIFRFGADAAGWRAASWEITEQHARLVAEELQAEARAIELLVAWIERRRTVAVQRERLEFTRQYHAIAKTRVERGVLPAEELDKVAIDLANNEASLQNEVARFNSAFANMKAAIHERHEIIPDSVSFDWPWKEKFHLPTVKAWLERQSDPSLSPVFTASRAALNAAENRSRRLRRLILPSLDLSYSWQRSEPEVGSASNARVGLLTLSVPLLEGFRDYTAARIQAATEIGSRLAFEEAAREIPSRQDVASKNFRIAHETALSRERTLISARSLLKSSLGRFRVGRMRADELLLDQNRVVQAELLAVEGWAEAHRSLARLLHAYGQSVRSL